MCLDRFERSGALVIDPENPKEGQSHRIHGTGIFTYIWLTMLNVGKYTIHGLFGLLRGAMMVKITPFQQRPCAFNSHDCKFIQQMTSKLLPKPLKTLLKTNISLFKATFEDGFPIPQVGYVVVPCKVYLVPRPQWQKQGFRHLVFFASEVVSIGSQVHVLQVGTFGWGEGTNRSGCPAKAYA